MGSIPSDAGGAMASSTTTTETSDEAAIHPTWTFSSKPGESSLFRAVEAVLRARPDWRQTSSNVHFDLLLCERWKVPYARLGARDGARPGMRQAVNHQRGSKGITVKGLMVKSLRAHCDATPGIGCVSDIGLPETHLVVPGEGVDAPERVRLLASSPGGSPWICKPTGGAHGKGIHIAATPEEAVSYVDAALKDAKAGDAVVSETSHLKNPSEATNAKQKPWQRGPVKPRAPPAWLVQRYLANPMLLDGRKFDIRAFALVTHDRRVHFYDDWIVRTCSVPFDMSNLSDRASHISNHCVQVQSESYGAHEEGNEIFADDMRAYLERAYPELEEEAPPSEGEATSAKISRGRRLYEGIVAQMRAIAAHTVASVAESLGGDDAFDSFQLLGYDFMPDEDGKVWLLEVNGSPAAAARITPSLAADVVALAIDGMYPPAEYHNRADAAGEGGGDVERFANHPRWTDVSSLVASDEKAIVEAPTTPPKP